MAGMFGRLYRGETDIDFLGRRKYFYLFSGVVLTICLLSLIFRGFNLGIDFAGGAVFQFPAASTTVEEVEDTVRGAGIDGEVDVQRITGGGNAVQYRVQTQELTTAQVDSVTDAIVAKFEVDRNAISPESVGPKWGQTVTNKALRGLGAFLLLVIAYISLRFEPRMAAASIAALFHDIIVTAGVYSLIGFEVTPSTVIAFLTILGYSLYDNVVVFDKLRENTLNIAGGSKTTYTGAANQAINQTLMRSFNTTLTSLLPVGSLLFVGSLALGARTLLDLSLSLFVGMATGAYSSVFFATPLLVEMKEREPQYQALTKRVQGKGAAAARAGLSPAAATAGGGSSRVSTRTSTGGGTASSSTASTPAAPASGGTRKPADSSGEGTSGAKSSRTPPRTPRPPKGKAKGGRPGGKKRR